MSEDYRLRRTAARRSLYIAFCVLTALPITFAQRPQIPYLTATSLRRGTIISHDQSSRLLGDTRFSHSFTTTDGICAVKIQLRTLGHLTSPYEVQCFFVAIDKSKTRYVYDAIKAISAREFDDITVVARDLFAGSETQDKATTTTYVSGMTSNGQAG